MGFKTKQMEEALERMRKMKLHQDTLRDIVNGKVQYSERANMGGSVPVPLLYWLDEEKQKKVTDWEKETGHLVFHVSHENTEFGELLTLYYVSCYEEEWEYDRDLIQNNVYMAYVMNLDEEIFSEYGTVGFKSVAGGIIRTA